MAGITVCCGRREKGSAYDYSSESKTTRGSGGRFGKGLFKRNRRAANSSAATGGGYRDTTTGGAEDGIPLDSRQKVLSAFEDSRA